MKHRLFLVVVVLLIGLLAGPSVAEHKNPRPTFDDFFRAVWMVESGGRANPPAGDGGRALGPLQIHRAAWRDALDYEPGIGGTYEDCRGAEYSKRVMRAYIRRWCGMELATGDWDACARAWNSGGPGWKSKRHLTDGYAAKVRRELDRLSREG